MSDYPLIKESNVSNWFDKTDVLVIGFGAGGSCAALGAKEEDVDVSTLKESDTVLVKPGEKIPADGIVLSGKANVNVLQNLFHLFC